MGATVDPGASVSLQSDTSRLRVRPSHRRRRARRAEQSPPSATIGTRFVVEVRACRGASRIDHWRDADGDLHERAPDHLEGGSSRREHFGAARLKLCNSQ